MLNKFTLLLIGLIVSLLISEIYVKLIFYVQWNIGSWSMQYFSKYLTISLTFVDNCLVSFSPLILAIIQLYLKDYRINILLIDTLFAFALSWFMLLLGLTFALFSWEGPMDSLLPDYYKVSPSKYYWSAFLLLGTIVLILYKFLFRSK